MNGQSYCIKKPTVLLDYLIKHIIVEDHHLATKLITTQSHGASRLV